MPNFNAKMHQNRFRQGGERRGGEGREGKEGERSTCLPPRFDNPGYGPDFVSNLFPVRSAKFIEIG